MREILFKAKVKEEPSDWAEGYLSKCEREFIISDDNGVGVFIIPDTICQYTGLTDKNGNKIWENDVVRLPKLFGSEIGQVVYLVPSFKSYCKAYGYTQLCGEVIGNIFDNPELVERN